jgi:phosphoadenosine phosphosulfate reductase
VISDCLELLRCVRQQTDAIGVAFSAGKDSLATLDLICSSGLFKRVEAFYLYRVEALKPIERIIRLCERRYGIEIRRLPHYDLARLFRRAVLMPHWAGLDRIPPLSFAEIENVFRTLAKVEWVAYGWRVSDSIARLRILRGNRGLWPEVKRVFPIWQWKRDNVHAYLAARRLPLPPTFGRQEQGGADLHPCVLEYLDEHDPEGAQKLREVFPWIEVLAGVSNYRDETQRHQAAPAESESHQRQCEKAAEPRARRRRAS